MAGIKDVARAAKVSVSTVSYVLSGKRSVSAETASRVMTAVKKLRYTPDASARKMRGIRNKIIALSEPIRGDINQAIFNAYFLQTAWQIKNKGYDLLLLTGEDEVGDIRRVTQSNLVDGVILMDIEQNDLRAAQANTYSKPCVAIGYPHDHSNCACVDIDFKAAGYKAAECLYDKGHKTVAFLRDNESDYERGSGYVILFRKSLMARARELGMTIVESSKHEMDKFDAADFLSDILSMKNRPTAIINQANANILNQVLQVMHADGLSVPRDMSILSCGTYLEGESMTQPITEMPVMPKVLCSAAVNILVSAIEDQTDIDGLVKLYAPEMHSHGSVGDVSDTERNKILVSEKGRHIQDNSLPRRIE